MSSEPFKVDLGVLKTQSKDTSKQTIKAVEDAGDSIGFIDRSPTKKRGRKPSPRTGQIHAKVMPNISTEIANEARRRGVQQGVIIEEAWAAYNKLSD